MAKILSAHEVEELWNNIPKTHHDKPLSRSLATIMQLQDQLRSVLWMARRYADGRSTYAPSNYNDVVRSLQARGVELEMVDGTLWARDGMGRAFDRLTDEEAATGNDLQSQGETR